MSKTVTVVDYGIGNIFSVTRAFEKCGAKVIVSGNADEIMAAERLVLPGVGAFSNGMQGLQSRDLIVPIKDYSASGKPLLGICLGMQMLFTESEEFGSHQGLDIISGTIAPITPHDESGRDMKVPHIGWSKLNRPHPDALWDDSILKHLGADPYCYFVHSFTAVPTEESSRLADAQYGDCRISAAVRKGNVFGCQFHPEKSGATGLKIISGFLEF
ncbi:imidazole glycerol phosphate synthase subunit HisH [Achromobacter dolens]|uniref:imidazole glycerol phosphate synthase subunit HisH n=1 Tax=Achromobacter dolens TaxID=1287738 RepID=UPI0007DE8689|nr:imidazole glycerol phosphate synthase, glutamine amidotransferase subunit [Achromobacter xylosoxidans]